ncbi:MAG: hypothetical protein K2I84_01950, partial [Bacteroidales bacterium]|nr:hypothetical protein [Bacteroidales bacterium]
MMTEMLSLFETARTAPAPSEAAEAGRQVAAHCSILRWATGDRPREKMLTGHPGVLTDSELLAILIGSGSARMSAVELSRQMLAAFGGNLHLMADRSAKELCG